MSPQLALIYWQTQGRMLLVTFLLTTVFVPFYRYFLDRRGVIENACIQLLLEDFGEAMVRRYCDSVCSLNKSDAQLGKFLSPGIGVKPDVHLENDHLRAYAVAAVLIRRHGFAGARSRLVQYKERPARRVERISLGVPCEVDLGGIQWPCRIKDVSEDGSGLAVTIDKAGDNWGHVVDVVEPESEVAIVVSGQRFDLQVARRTTKARVMTLGLRSPDVPAYRRALLNTLRPLPIAS